MFLIESKEEYLAALERKSFLEEALKTTEENSLKKTYKREIETIDHLMVEYCCRNSPSIPVPKLIYEVRLGVSFTLLPETGILYLEMVEKLKDFFLKVKPLLPEEIITPERILNGIPLKYFKMEFSDEGNGLVSVMLCKMGFKGCSDTFFNFFNDLSELNAHKKQGESEMYPALLWDALDNILNNTEKVMEIRFKRNRSYYYRAFSDLKPLEYPYSHHL